MIAYRRNKYIDDVIALLEIDFHKFSLCPFTKVRESMGCGNSWSVISKNIHGMNYTWFVWHLVYEKLLSNSNGFDLLGKIISNHQARLYNEISKRLYVQKD